MNHVTIINSIQPNPKSFSQNLICNFRAPSLKEYSEWQKYKAYIKNQGLDICRVTIGLTNAFMAGIEGAEQVNGKEQNVHITMNNQFLYQVQKPNVSRIACVVSSQSIGEHLVVFFLKPMCLIELGK